MKTAPLSKLNRPKLFGLQIENSKKFNIYGTKPRQKYRFGNSAEYKATYSSFVRRYESSNIALFKEKQKWLCSAT